MCGIGALLDPGGASVQDAPQRMLEALRHRGPDGEGIRRTGPVTLAHTRLAIIDVAGGDQPLDSEDGAVTLIVNGEIYNHRTLRAKLEERGHRFATNSDSEAILHAYEESGPECVRQLNGIFAFVLWDEHRKRLVAARDEFGVKPLYWWSDGTRVAIASEIGAILDAGLARPEVDRKMMSDVPYGAFLPGGVDSAAVVAAMALRAPNPPTTFTIGFPGAGPVFDEREAAAESARLIGTEHHATATAETDFLTELAAAVPRLEEPCGIPSAPALGQLSRFAADKVKVVLAGQGADEPLTCSAEGATPIVCCVWWRSPTPRCGRRCSARSARAAARPAPPRGATRRPSASP